MKNRKNFWQAALGMGLIASIILTQSCKKSFLNVDPAGNQKAASFYKTQDDASAAVSAMYASLHSYASVAFPALAIESMGSGDVDKGSVPSDASFMNDFIKFNVTAGEGQVPDFWNGEYVIINLANQNLDNIPAINMDASLKARYLAESKFIRAWAYFRLVRAYGDVPLRLHIPKDATEYNLPRTPKAQVYAAIEQDLTDAAGVLPQSYSGADIGRITKGAALSLHAKVAMYQQKWPDVLTYTNSVISSGAYSLFPDYEQMFRTNHKNNSESIFEIQTSYIASNSVANVSQYAQVQGARIANGGWGFNVPNAALAAAFEPGDPRKDATFLNEGETTPEGDVIPTGLDNPAYNQKTYVPFAIVLSQPDGPYGVSQDYIAIRYADVLLMNAEAKNESGDAAGALVSLNLVRARARLGAPSGTLLNITETDKTALRTIIWHERRVELALEFDHYFDVIRRGDAEATAEFGGRGWKAGKNEVWPIPQNEIDLSAGTLVQNPGY